MICTELFKLTLFRPIDYFHYKFDMIITIIIESEGQEGLD